MLETVTLNPKRFADYQGVISDQLRQQTQQAASFLQGARVLHISATSQGGGVSEILHSMVPLLRDLGIQAEWQTIDAGTGFFTVTKKIHNSLQGFSEEIKPAEWDLYKDINRKLAQALDVNAWDIIVTHDPQPTAIINNVSEFPCKWVWRCHLDASHPSSVTKETFQQYLNRYDGAIFTLPKYVFADFGDCTVGTIPVAIDPLSAKNQSMKQRQAKKIVSKFGIDPKRPFMVQVSRFDPWKDPEGVVKAWQLAKAEVPDLQLALVGNTAADDPQSKDILASVRALDQEDDDLHVVADAADDKAVHAFQATADVVIQKSIREGFGLTVTEAMWSAAPVVATAVGGIPLQIQDGQTGYLVDGVVAASQRIVELVRNPERAQAMGERARQHVRENFLLPRMIRDHLQFLASLGQ